MRMILPEVAIIFDVVPHAASSLQNTIFKSIPPFLHGGHPLKLLYNPALKDYLLMAGKYGNLTEHHLEEALQSVVDGKLFCLPQGKRMLWSSFTVTESGLEKFPARSCAFFSAESIATRQLCLAMKTVLTTH